MLEDFNPETGEVTTSYEAGFDPEVVGPEYDRLDEQVGDTERALSTLRDRRGDLEVVIKRNVPVGSAIAGRDGAMVAVVEGSTPPRQVDRVACGRRMEELLDLGLGELTFKPPTLAQLRDRQAELAARGIALEELAPKRAAGAPRVEVVRP